MQFVTNDTADLALTGQLAVSPAAVGPLFAVKAHLCQANIPFDRNTTLTDLTTGEADYTGYAAQTVTWQPPTQADDGTIEMIGIVPAFIPTGTTVTNQIYGAWLETGTGGDLWACGGFDGAPLPMNGPTNQITITVRWRPLYGAIVVVVS